MRIIVITCLLISIMLLLIGRVFAQEKSARATNTVQDSIKALYLEQYALKNPLVRQFSISSEVIKRNNFSSSLYGNDFVKGDAQIIRNSVSAKIPVLSWGCNSISTGIDLYQQHVELSNVDNYNKQLQVDNISFNTTTTKLSLGYSRQGTMFNKSVLYHIGASSLFNDFFSESQFSATGLMLFDIKRTANTSISIGGVFLISPRPIIPAFAVINYYHRFQSVNIELTANLPYYLSLRKELSRKHSLSFVNELGGSSYFYKFSNDYLPKKGQYSAIEVKSGILYEYRLSKKLIVGINGGLLYSGNSKMYYNKSYFSKSYLIRSNASVDPYVNIKLSLLPFIKGFKW